MRHFLMRIVKLFPAEECMFYFRFPKDYHNEKRDAPRMFKNCKLAHEKSPFSLSYFTMCKLGSYIDIGFGLKIL